VNSKSDGVSWRCIRVWQRNIVVWKRCWKISFLPPMFEPVLFILAFGAGLGAFIKEVPYRGEMVPYLPFIAPGIIAASMMNNAFFECSFGSFIRMYYQKTFDAIMTTPLSALDVIAGELIYGASKSLLATAIMIVIITPFGFLSYPTVLLLLPLAFMTGLVFAGIGMVCTSLVPQIENFNVPMFLLITPMFLFSGTFFPLDNFPLWARCLSNILPLTHSAELTRACTMNMLSVGHLLNLAALIPWIVIPCWTSMLLMRRRLIDRIALPS
jgi:lipooligosaccharide transport system permease protein